MLHLNMKDALPKIRAAFDAGELQGQRPEAINQSCAYSGPCAIGVAIPEEIRYSLDARGQCGIYSLIQSGTVVVPDEQRVDFATMQGRHDSNAGLPYFNHIFGDFLEKMEAKYVRA